MIFKEKFLKISLLIIAGFSVLAGYNFIRSISVPLFIESFGKDRMPEATVVMGLTLFLLMSIHGKLLSLFGPARTCLISHFFSIMTFLLCYMGIINGNDLANYILFVAKDIYIVVLIEHYWSYFNSTFKSGSAKKISGLFAGIVSIGPILSGYFVTYATPLMSDAKDWIWLTAISIAPAALAMFLIYWIYPLARNQEKTQITSGQLFAWNNFHSYPQLKLLAWMVIITQFIAASTTFAFNSKVALELVDVSLQTAYYGTFYSNINLIAGIIQFLFAPFILLHVPTLIIFVVLAIIHITVNTYAWFDGSLFSVMFASLLFKSLDYSVFRCAKELFYIPLNFSARFNSKHLIDVFFYRASNSGVSTLFALGKSLGQLKDVHYTLVAGVAATGWLMLLFKFKKQLPKDLSNASS